jgi:hypothetical protein
MSTKSSTRKEPRNMPVKDRRAAPGAKNANGKLRQLKGLLGRPLGLERRGDQVHVVLVDRRRAPPADKAPSLSQLRAELRERMLIQEHSQGAQVMRHLALVHDELGRSGWPGIGALPVQVLDKALVQAEMLASEEPSSSLDMIIDQLRSLQLQAARRDERDSKLAEFENSTDVEVCMATHDEYDELERSWAGTIPAALRSAQRDE